MMKYSIGAFSKYEEVLPHFSCFQLYFGVEVENPLGEIVYVGQMLHEYVDESITLVRGMGQLWRALRQAAISYLSLLR